MVRTYITMSRSLPPCGRRPNTANTRNTQQQPKHQSSRDVQHVICDRAPDARHTSRRDLWPRDMATMTSDSDNHDVDDQWLTWHGAAITTNGSWTTDTLLSCLSSCSWRLGPSARHTRMWWCAVRPLLISPRFASQIPSCAEVMLAKSCCKEASIIIIDISRHQLLSLPDRSLTLERKHFAGDESLILNQRYYMTFSGKRLDAQRRPYLNFAMTFPSRLMTCWLVSERCFMWNSSQGCEFNHRQQVVAWEDVELSEAI